MNDFRLFRRIHYFGRKIKFGLHHDDENDTITDLAGLLLDPRFRNILPEIIEAIYEEDPDRSEMLTSEDIFDYLRRLGDKQRLLREEMNQAYVPEGFKYWKYADQDTTKRDSIAGFSVDTTVASAPTPIEEETTVPVDQLEPIDPIDSSDSIKDPERFWCESKNE